MSSSEISRASPSTIMIESSEAEITRSMSLSSCCFIGGIGDETAFHPADAYAGDWRVEWNIGQTERQGCGGDAEHIGVIYLVCGERIDEDLNLVAESLGKKRTNAAVDETGIENFAISWLALAFEKAAGDLPAA